MKAYRLDIIILIFSGPIISISSSIFDSRLSTKYRSTNNSTNTGSPISNLSGKYFDIKIYFDIKYLVLLKPLTIACDNIILILRPLGRCYLIN